MTSILFYLLICFAINQPVYCSYQYVGCYVDVSLDSYFTSSFMEPTLCFRLCDTSIVYLQKNTCRCSGAGLMSKNRLNDNKCNIECAKPVDGSVRTKNTCGDQGVYSAYAQEHFFTKHGHLFNYSISFSSCERWEISSFDDAYETNFDGILKRSSLNKLERCAAACLDQNITTNSIAFHDDTNKCLCILPSRSSLLSTQFRRKVLPNSSCNRYCNISYEGTPSDIQYQCGSLLDPHIWAIYNLNGTCPENFAYIKELKKCVSTYKNFWNSCTSPSKAYVYDGSVPWNTFLTVIAKLNLNESVVTVDFDDDVVVNSSWKCPNLSSSSSSSSSSVSLSFNNSPYRWRTSNTYGSYYPTSYSYLFGWQSSTRYILENGCLRDSSYTTYAHRYSYRLCAANPINQYSEIDEESSNKTLISIVSFPVKLCASQWFDINGRCYRMSDERKSIAEARISCIDTSLNDNKNQQDQSRVWSLDGERKMYDDIDLVDSPKGEIVKYSSEWQARIGFFLLDTDPDSDTDKTKVDTTTIFNSYYEETLVLSDTNGTTNTIHGTINEFQALENVEDEANETLTNICTVVTRTTSETEEKPIIVDIKGSNCTSPRHVLCESKPLVVQNFEYECFEKPEVLGVPALISSLLTHELCLTVCQELQTKLAILHKDKCYCLNPVTPHKLNLTSFRKHKRAKCGDPCPGNRHEICGNDKTIVVFHILDSRRTFTVARTPAEPYPPYAYDSCALLNNFNTSVFYTFKFDDNSSLHPQYCLAFCETHQQKYALMNNGKCLCTNKPLKEENDNADDDYEILNGQNCSHRCASSYFYTCGNGANDKIYSIYILKARCRHGFEVAENNEQCVYCHFSTTTNSLASAKDYCEKIGATLAKINDIIEIQDILTDSILHTRLMQQLLVYYRFRFVNDTRYYWVDRTTDTPDPSTISARLLNPCSKMSSKGDANCITILYEPSSNKSIQSHERCIAESNDCSTKTAMPICVDKHIGPKMTIVPPISDENPSDVTINITADYYCGENNDDYHLFGDYCYKISYHETIWSDAKSVCQKENAILFVPEKSVTLQFIKSLFSRKKGYTSSGFAHVGVYYDTKNRTVIENNLVNDSNSLIVPDSNAVYDLCKKTFLERFTAVMSSTSLTQYEKSVIKTQQLGCGYIALGTDDLPVIRCNEIPCNKTAAVVCQKAPMRTIHRIHAKREYSEQQSSSIPTKTSPKSLPALSTDGDDDDDDNLSSISVSSSASDAIIGKSTTSEPFNDVDPTEKSISRDYAPIFFIFTLMSVLLLLIVITTVYNRHYSVRRYQQRYNTNSVYSQLTSANEYE